MDAISYPFAVDVRRQKPCDCTNYTASNRQIRALTIEHPVAAELARIRGMRVYAQITANNSALDSGVGK